MRCEIQEDLIAFVTSFPLVLLCSLAFPCSLFFSAFLCAFIIIYLLLLLTITTHTK